MKNIYYSFFLIMLVAFSSCAGSRVYNQGGYDQNEYSQDYGYQDGAITYQQFYDQLSPYGNWMNYQNYGYVWVPNMPGFRPYYTGGQWAYTNYGWTWVSQYDWGWAPFHYGRWFHDMAFGWVWVPGYEWGPAWVSWRGGGDYYGWAPMGPGGGMMGNIPYDNWTFVPSRYINSPRINNYYVNRSRNVTIINNTTIINRTVNNNNINGRRPAYNPGPSVADVERSTRSKIRQFNIEDARQPGSSQVGNNAIRVYRPTVKADASNNREAAPARVFTAREVEANRQNNTDRPAQRPSLPNRNQQNVNTPQNDQPANNSRPRRQAQTPATQQPATAPATRPAREFNNERQAPPADNNRQQNAEPVQPMIKNEPSRNIPDRQPARQFNTEQSPVNRNTNTPPPNTPVRPPSRSFNNSDNSASMRQSAPAVRTSPVQSADRSSADSRPTVRRSIGANE